MRESSRLERGKPLPAVLFRTLQVDRSGGLGVRVLSRAGNRGSYGAGRFGARSGRFLTCIPGAAPKRETVRTVPHGLVEIGAYETAERVDRQRHSSRQLLEKRPAEWSSRRMRGRRKHRAQDHKIDSELDRARKLDLVVARCRA